MLHFFGADQDVFLNLTSIRRPAHRDNLPSVLGYETDSSYPHAPYIRNAKVGSWKRTFAKFSQSLRRPLLGPSPGLKLSLLSIY